MAGPTPKIGTLASLFMPSASKNAEPKSSLTSTIRKVTTLMDNYANPNMKYGLGKRLVGAGLSMTEQTVLRGTVGRAIQWKVRGDKKAFARIIGGKLASATVGRMGAIGEAFSTWAAIKMDIVDNLPAIEEINQIKKKARKNDGMVSNQDLLLGLEKTAKNLDQRFGIMFDVTLRLGEDMHRMDERSKHIEKISKQNILKATEEVSQRMTDLTKPVIGRLDEVSDEIHKISSSVVKHESEIDRLRQRMNIMIAQGVSGGDGGSGGLGAMTATDSKFAKDMPMWMRMVRGGVNASGISASLNKFGIGKIMNRVPAGITMMNSALVGGGAGMAGGLAGGMLGKKGLLAILGMLAAGGLGASAAGAFFGAGGAQAAGRKGAGGTAKAGAFESLIPPINDPKKFQKWKEKHLKGNETLRDYYRKKGIPMDSMIGPKGGSAGKNKEAEFMKPFLDMFPDEWFGEHSPRHKKPKSPGRQMPGKKNRTWSDWLQENTPEKGADKKFFQDMYKYLFEEEKKRIKGGGTSGLSRPRSSQVAEMGRVGHSTVFGAGIPLAVEGGPALGSGAFRGGGMGRFGGMGGWGGSGSGGGRSFPGETGGGGAADDLAQRWGGLPGEGGKSGKASTWGSDIPTGGKGLQGGAGIPKRFSNNAKVMAALNQVAKKHGVDPAAIAQVIKMESGWDPGQRTGSYRGLTQMGAATWKDPSVKNGRIGGLTYKEYVNASPEDQIKTYGAWLDHYQFGKRNAKVGLDLSKLNPAQQAAILQANQFSPNGMQWRKAAAEGNFNVPSSPMIRGKRAKQASALGDTSIGDMSRYYAGKLKKSPGRYAEMPQLQKAAEAEGKSRPLGSPRQPKQTEGPSGYTFPLLSSTMAYANAGRTSGFGTGRDRWHSGVDLYPVDPETKKARIGTDAPVFMPMDGQVTKVYRTRKTYKKHGNRTGNMIEVMDKNGIKHRFLHLSPTQGINPRTKKPWRAGDKIAQGDHLAYVGGTGTMFGDRAQAVGEKKALAGFEKGGYGNVTPAHLHYEMRYKGQRIDPHRYFPEYAGRSHDRRVTAKKKSITGWTAADMAKVRESAGLPPETAEEFREGAVKASKPPAKLVGIAEYAGSRRPTGVVKPGGVPRPAAVPRPEAVPIPGQAVTPEQVKEIIDSSKPKPFKPVDAKELKDAVTPLATMQKDVKEVKGVQAAQAKQEAKAKVVDATKPKEVKVVKKVAAAPAAKPATAKLAAPPKTIQAKTKPKMENVAGPKGGIISRPAKKAEDLKPKAPKAPPAKKPPPGEAAKAPPPGGGDRSPRMSNPPGGGGDPGGGGGGGDPGGGKDLTNPGGYQPESAEPSPGDNGYGQYMQCYI